ncbi:hypothetical protein [Bradyrhizobium sp. SZCCHNR3118]|nr:hypothetical protein [Bradyrhizobium sp. SZCCHNR3118]
MNQNLLNIILTVAIIFNAALNVASAIKLNHAQDQVQSIFCVEKP